MVDRLRLTQVNLDTKQGTVARDLFIDIQADELDRLYRTTSVVSEKQSPETAVGRDLDRWARNYGIIRRGGSPSNGINVFTTNDISTDIPIPPGTIGTARNGASFSSIGSFIMSVAEKNKYAATANRLRGALDAAGISDQFAIEVPFVATRAGTSGNIAPLQIIGSNLEDSLRITNLTSYNGGSNTESDAAFRSRVFAIFSGANTGTSSGYRNAALSVPGVLDALVVEPGNTLMLRDGTETIEINDGSFRILNSGTGGKVDVYILGNQLEEIVESFLYTDLSGRGDASDERNDIVPGQSRIDQSFTSEERRVRAFKTGNLPLQPVNSVVTLIGTGSGILAEKTVDAQGNVSGNYELVKDVNVETGGSPFGFDKIRFTSSVKDVEAETISKSGLNSIDALRFTDVKNVSNIFQDIQVVGENSGRSTTDRTIIKLNHSPIVSVDRVVNSTTGEVYVIESQNIDDSGLNTEGSIQISGKTLPSTADILSVDYTWRLFYDGALDYNGEELISLFKDDSVVDSIDWGVSNGIFLETSVIGETEDGLEFTVDTEYPISRVISVFSAETTTSEIVNVTTIDELEVPGVELALTDSVISNVISVKNDNGVELFDTLNNDQTFSGRTIFLPSDTSAEVGESVTVFYNKTEFFDISSGNGSFSNTTITLPSEDILAAEGLLDEVESLFLTEDDIFTEYVAAIESLIPSQALTFLPVSGSEVGNALLDSTLTGITNSSQPVFFDFDDAGDPGGISRFGPTRLTAAITGSTTAGVIKAVGTTLTRLELDITAGVSINGDTIDLSPDLKSVLGVTTLPTTIFVARVDSIEGLDSNQKYDIAGYSLQNNLYSFGTANLDESLSATTLTVPNTTNNSTVSFTSGEKVRVSLLLGNNNDFEELYFAGDGTASTDKVFGRIDRLSVSSGFRSTVGTLIGSIVVSPTSQPGVGLPYSVNYSFVSPKEGERLTLRYNLNRLVIDTTVSVENVRSITADVLVKESFQLPIDVSGEIVINENAKSSANTILENASNDVVNLLNSSTLGTIVDYSDIISVVASVVGVDSVNISLFNESGNIGRRTFVKALDNQYISAGSISFKAVPRKDFRIT
jgi:phage-related baseplate assembly protein